MTRGITLSGVEVGVQNDLRNVAARPSAPTLPVRATALAQHWA